MHNTVITKGYLLLVDSGTSPIIDGELIYSYIADEITYRNRDSQPGTYRRIIGHLRTNKQSEPLEAMVLPEKAKYGLPYGFDVLKIEGNNLVGEYLYQHNISKNERKNTVNIAPGCHVLRGVSHGT